LSVRGYVEYIDTLYNSNHECNLADDNTSNNTPIWDSSVVEKHLKKIHKGFDVKNNIETEVYEATRETLNKAVDKGFAGFEFGDSDKVFLEELKYNNAVFAAFKTYRNQNQIAKLLIDEKGNARSFAEFIKVAKPVAEKFNVQHMRTEYTTAVRRAQITANFRQFRRDEDIAPNLTWIASRSAEPRTSHKKYYGLTLDMNHSFWKEHFPGDEWGCKCGIEQTDEQESTSIPESTSKQATGLDENPADTARIFSPTNVYERRVSTRVKEAIKEFVYKQEIKRLKNELKVFRESIPQYGALELTAKNLQEPVHIIRKSVKEIAGHTLSPEVLAYIPTIPNDVKNWKYLGWQNVEEGKHKEALYFTYYEINILNKIFYVNVMKHKYTNQNIPYAIQISINDKRLKKGYPK
jgi:hypothetical protein